MRLPFLIAILAALLISTGCKKKPRQLPKAAEIPTRLAGTPPPRAFEPDPSGGLSRTIFETQEHPNFKLVIRDFSFPPDQRPHTLTLPSSAVLHLLSGPGEINIAKQRLTLTSFARTVVPSGAPIVVQNRGEQPMVLRALILEGK
jgi:quercetin dioxygenase-like cupin family protein